VPPPESLLWPAKKFKAPENAELRHSATRLAAIAALWGTTTVTAPTCHARRCRPGRSRQSTLGSATRSPHRIHRRAS